MKILILCTGNSCRSQMAHGFLHSFDPSLEVYSAGTKASGKLNSQAVEVMKEAGIDISHHTSDSVDNYLNEEWDYVITVCGGANESCPTFSGKVKNRLHIGFEDPSEVKGAHEFIHAEFIRVRDEIKKTFYNFYQDSILFNKLNERSDSILICHCGKITLGDIRKATKANCTNLKSVRHFLDKHNTGKCGELSPSGECCHKRFEKVIIYLMGQN